MWTARRLLALVSPRTPVKKRNDPRADAAFEWAYHSKERVLFVKALPCLVRSCLTRPSDNAHALGNDGASRRGHYTTIVPACRAHHDELDAGDGRAAFEAKYSVDLAFSAAATEHAWQQHQGGRR